LAGFLLAKEHGTELAQIHENKPINLISQNYLLIAKALLPNLPLHPQTHHPLVKQILSTANNLIHIPKLHSHKH
jgi:hypothetical protein